MAKNKLNIMEAVTKTAITTGGAIAGTFVTTGIEKALIKAGNPNANKLAPWITTGIGIAGQIFAPQMLQNAFLGMTVVSSAEGFEGLMNKPAPVPTAEQIAIATGTGTTPIAGIRQQANVEGVRQNANVQGYRNY